MISEKVTAVCDDLAAMGFALSLADDIDGSTAVPGKWFSGYNRLLNTLFRNLVENVHDLGVALPGYDLEVQE